MSTSKDLKKQISKGKLPDYLKRGRNRAGFTPVQKRQYCEWLHKFYIKKLWTTKLSYQSEVASNILERSAKALKKVVFSRSERTYGHEQGHF